MLRHTNFSDFLDASASTSNVVASHLLGSNYEGEGEEIVCKILSDSARAGVIDVDFLSADLKIQLASRTVPVAVPNIGNVFCGKCCADSWVFFTRSNGNLNSLYSSTGGHLGLFLRTKLL